MTHCVSRPFLAPFVDLGSNRLYDNMSDIWRSYTALNMAGDSRFGFAGSEKSGAKPLLYNELQNSLDPYPQIRCNTAP